MDKFNTIFENTMRHIQKTRTIVKNMKTRTRMGVNCEPLYVCVGSNFDIEEQKLVDEIIGLYNNVKDAQACLDTAFELNRFEHYTWMCYDLRFEPGILDKIHVGMRFHGWGELNEIIDN